MTAAEGATEGGQMNFSERERARYHLNRRRGGGAPKAEPQTEALFDEPEHQRRQLVSLPADETLFPEPSRAGRRAGSSRSTAGPGYSAFAPTQKIIPSPPSVTA